MSSQDNGEKLIEIDTPSALFSPQLQFQEFSPNSPGCSEAAKLDVHSVYNINYNPSLKITGNRNKSPTYDDVENPPSSIWSIEYYQQLFDVNTDQVVERLLWAMVPKPGVNYLQQYIKSKPDLYGPFWICVTLVFAIAVSGNLASYLQNAAAGQIWKYNFHHVTMAGTAIFVYAWILPTCLWGFLKYNEVHDGSITLLELLCVYGYSLAIYIPISVLWVIQISWLQWMLVIIGAAMSGYVLITAIWPVISDKNWVLLALIMGCHILLAVSFMLYYFHTSPSTLPALTTPQPSPVSDHMLAPNKTG